MIRRIKHLWQKITRGFSDDVTWNLDKELAKWLLPRLKRFRELNRGYPSQMTAEGWDRKLDKMIKACEIEIHESECTLWAMFDSEDAKMAYYKRLAQEREEGFKLLGKYLSHLWW